jgi:hypothetical protein
VSITGHLARLTRQLRDALTGLFDQDHPFGRLALVHTLFSAGTTLVTISLAGSLFFSVGVDESVHKVLLYLLLSIAPFAVVSPMLSPLLDRGVTARRTAIGLACGGSAVLTLFMSRDLHSLLLFPEAFGILVLSKLYLVGKAALVPSMTASTDDLASANAKLAVLAALGGFAASPFGVALLQAGAPWVLRFTFLVFVGGGVAAVRLPKSNTVPAAPKTLGELDDGRPILGPTPPAPLPQTPLPQAARSSGQSTGRPGGLIYRSRSGRAARPPRIDVAKERRRLGLAMVAPEVTVALGAMSVLRGTMGFLTFFLAFALKHLGAATWWYGFILLASGIGGLAGSMAVPSVRRRLSEQQIILAALVLTTIVGVIVAILGTLWAQPILAFVVGVASTGAKPAFDSIAQTYVPPAALGRAFARFETQLQLCWVGSALIAVLVSSFRFASGDVLIAAACAIAAAFHYSMRHSFVQRDGVRRSAEPLP